MADNFSNIAYPVTGSTFELKINYQINLNAKEKKRLSLDFKFLIVENELTTASTPTVAEMIAEFEKFVLKRLLTLLGRNCQITSMTLKNAGLNFFVPLYKFGYNETNSMSPEVALFFLIQPFNKLTSYRLYLKGAATSYAQKPLPVDELSEIQNFESLFTSNLVFLNGLLVMKLVRNADSFISATFREVKRFQPRKPKPKVLTKRLKPKAKPKPKKKKVAS